MASKKRQNENQHPESGEPPNKKKSWQCHICFKSYTSGHRRQHLEDHTRYTTCPMCERHLGRKCVLQKHLEVVHKGAPLRCKMWCDETNKTQGFTLTPQSEFPNAKALADHVWSHHPQEVDPFDPRLAPFRRQPPQDSTRVQQPLQPINTSVVAPMEQSTPHVTPAISMDHQQSRDMSTNVPMEQSTPKPVETTPMDHDEPQHNNTTNDIFITPQTSFTGREGIGNIDPNNWGFWPGEPMDLSLSASMPHTQEEAMDLSVRAKEKQVHIPPRDDQPMDLSIRGTSNPTSKDHSSMELQPAQIQNKPPTTESLSNVAPSEPEGMDVENESDIENDLDTSIYVQDPDLLDPRYNLLSCGDEQLDRHVPESALLAPTTFPLKVLDEIPETYNEFNEDHSQIPREILENILSLVPEGAQEHVQANWRHIRSFTSDESSSITHEYNRRLIGNEQGMTIAQYFRDHIHDSQTTAYKVLASPGYLLERETDKEIEYRYYRPHHNMNAIPISNMSGSDKQDLTQNLVQPFLIKDDATLEHFLSHLKYTDILETTKRPSTQWKVFPNMMNINFWIIQCMDRPIGHTGHKFPMYLKRNQYIKPFIYDKYDNKYQDNLCVFRAVTYALDGELKGSTVKARFIQWLWSTGKDPETDITTFRGVNYTDLSSVEDVFNVRFNVYQLNHSDKYVELLRRSPDHPDRKLINVDIYQMEDISHFSYIIDLEKYAKKFFCNFCNQQFARSRNLLRHQEQNRCTRGIPRKRFIGGVHQEKKSIIQRLTMLGIKLRPTLKDYNEYIAVTDFESTLKPVRLSDSGLESAEKPVLVRPSTDGQQQEEQLKRYGVELEQVAEGEPEPRKLQFLHVHEPISFSILSNIPGYENEPFTVIEPDPEKLITAFLNHLEELAEKRKTVLYNRYSVELKAIEEKVLEAKKVIGQKKANDQNTSLATHYFYKVRSVLFEFKTWLKQLPIIGFNSGRYDLPLIKDYLYPLMVKRAREDATPQRICDFDCRMAKALKLPLNPTRLIHEKEKQAEHAEKEKQAERADLRALFCDEATEENSFHDEDDYCDGGYEEEDEDLAFKLDTENSPPKIRGLPSITKKGTTIMAVRTDELLFLDMSLYLAAGTSLDKFQKAWMKADEAREDAGLGEDEFGKIELVKLPFPYAFLDSPEKLDFKGVPEHKEFYNQLKGCNISKEEYQLVVDIYKEKNFVEFRDYLKLYNEVDVKPFLKAVQKQFMQYFNETGIDMFKECISLPGITLKYLHRKTQDYQFSLWTKEDESLHEEIRSQMTGGQSLVLHRLAIANETVIRGNEILMDELTRDLSEYHKMKVIDGYDANALYLYAVGQDMPVGHHTLWEQLRNETGLKKKRDSKPQAAEWLQYLSSIEDEKTKKRYTIINKYMHGFEERIGPLAIPVDGYCEETNTVYEYLGCFWHCHGRASCCLDCPTDINSINKKNSDGCLLELEERREYIESLGMNFVSIWECEWLAQREEESVMKKLTELNRPYAYNKFLSNETMLNAIKADDMFGFCQVTIDTPAHLRKLYHYRDFPPIVKNVMIGREDLTPYMLDHCVDNDLLRQPRKQLMSGFKGEKIWLLTSMVRYLMDKGLVVSKVHKVLQYDKARPFKWFVDKVTEARSAADSNDALEILGQAFKLLGNTAYGKTITNLEGHTNVYIVPLQLARQLANDPFLISLTPIRDTDCYEAVLRKREITFSLPEQIGIAVYNWAKIRMLQFAYDFLGFYMDPYKVAWCQTDTDSSYIMLAEDTLENCVKPEMCYLYNLHKAEWLVQGIKDKQTPGLFKLEYSGIKMVCLCSKTYQIIGKDGGYKSATKGVNKSSQFLFEDFKRVLLEKKGCKGFNIGFQKHQGANKICTYVCEREALSNTYTKRDVLKDGIFTQPYDHI